MAINRKMFRQHLNPGGALVPLTMNAAKAGIPKWKLLKMGAIPWAVDQFSDVLGMGELNTVEPEKKDEEEITATIVEENINNQTPDNGPPNAEGNVDLSSIEGSVPSEEESDIEKNAVYSNNEVGNNSVVSEADQEGLYAGAQNLEAGTLFPQNDSLTQVKDYADSLRSMLGDDKGQRLANTAMLAQLGMALMTGKTLQGGVSGFLDVAGQAGLQVAPMMIQMGMEKSKQDRELGLAAFQIWNEEQDKLKKRSGAFYNVYQVGYEFDSQTGAPKQLPNGQPRYSSNTFRDVVQQNSPEMLEYIAINQDPKRNPNYPFPLYIPMSQSASESGSAGISSRTSGLAPVTDAGAQDQLKFAKYISSNLDEVYKYMNIVMNKQHLIGAKGELGKFATAPAYYFNELLNAGGTNELQAASKYKGQGNEVINNLIDNYSEGSVNRELSADGTFGIVNNTPNSTMRSLYGGNYTGPDIPIFVDKYNEKGQNVGVSAENPYGEASVYLVKGELERMFTDPDIPGVQVFERTLGLLLARSRQPTGRMLADVLRASFNDASVTGFTGPTARPNMVINKLWSLVNKLEGDMQSGFQGANVISSNDAIKKYGSIKNAQALGLVVDDNPFNFPAKQSAIDTFYKLYFTPQANGQWVEQYTNFPLGTTPQSWAGSQGASIAATGTNDIIDLNEQINKELEALNN